MSELYLIGIMLSILIFIVPFFSMRTGLMMYLIVAFVFPSLWFGEITLRLELLYCIELVFLFFIRAIVSEFIFRWNAVLSKYWVFLITICLSTLFSLISNSKAYESSIFSLLIAFYGFFRPFLIMFLFMNFPTDVRLTRFVLQVPVWASIPIAVLSIGQSLGIPFAQKLTLLGYISPWRTPVLRMQEELGMIIRSTGVFESPVYNAVYFLLVLIVAGWLLIQGKLTLPRRLFLYLAVGLSFVGGITTLSATFLVGVTVLMGLFVLLLRPKHLQRLLCIGTMNLFMVSLFAAFLIPYIIQHNLFFGTLHYQVQRILSGSVLESRYDLQRGILASTYQAIKQRPVLGWGLIQAEENVFVGDSLYVVLLYVGGIIGLSLFLWLVWSILKYASQHRRADESSSGVYQIVFLTTLLLLIVGIGSPAFFLPRLKEWYWALVGLSLNRVTRCVQDTLT
ncbi:MAG: hypothetical protein QW829_05820 [Candidatus Bathyarchaeia archaeon]